MDNGETLSIEDVLNVAKETPLMTRLEIYTDSDYSGNLCLRARDWWKEFDEEKKKDQEPNGNDLLEGVIESFKMFSNTDSDKRCEKGKYQKMLL